MQCALCTSQTLTFTFFKATAPLLVQVITDEGRDVVQQLLTHDCSERPSASVVLQHAWFTKMVAEKDPKVLDSACQALSPPRKALWQWATRQQLPAFTVP